MFVFEFLLTLLYLYLATFVAYCLLLAIAGCFARPLRPEILNVPRGRFAILIPVYHEDAVIVSTVKRCLQHNYPRTHFSIYVVGKLRTKGAKAALAKLGAIYRYDKAKKGASLEHMVQALTPGFDFVMILDADNYMEQDCLLQANAYLQAGGDAVQLHRVSKNKNNTLAWLDAASEEINNHLFRKGQQVLGLSSSLIGSGMAFRLPVLVGLMKNMEGIWEDRELELRLFHRGLKIGYLEDAYVYDEKVEQLHVFFHQRQKWVQGQLQYIRVSCRYCLKGPIRKDLLHKTFQSLCPPRSLLLGVLVLFSFLPNFSSPASLLLHWPLLLGIYSVALLLSFPFYLIRLKAAAALLWTPVAIVVVAGAFVVSLANPRKHYHTPHRHQ